MQIDWLNLPPLNALRAFCAVAENGSYSGAADRLNVTHAAVGQQVRQLEARLGIALVQRAGRGIRLTAEGDALARDLSSGFALVDRAVARLSRDAAARPVQVTCSPAFAVEWLMPRLPAFRKACPDIQLLLNPTSELVPLQPGGADLAIRYRDRRRPVDGLVPVLVTDMVVIAAPGLIAGRPVSRPRNLCGLPWLQELGTNEVRDWFTLHGVVPPEPLDVTQMPGNLIMTAVRRGDGITYTAREFFREDLAAGRVVELFSEPAFGIYHVETAPGDRDLRVGRLVRWLKGQSPGGAV